MIVLLITTIVMAMAIPLITRRHKLFDNKSHGRYECYWNSEGKLVQKYTRVGGNIPIVDSGIEKEVDACVFSPVKGAETYNLYAIGGGGGGRSQAQIPSAISSVVDYQDCKADSTSGNMTRFFVNSIGNSLKNVFYVTAYKEAVDITNILANLDTVFKAGFTNSTFTLYSGGGGAGGTSLLSGIITYGKDGDHGVKCTYKYPAPTIGQRYSFDSYSGSGMAYLGPFIGDMISYGTYFGSPGQNYASGYDIGGFGRMGSTAMYVVGYGSNEYAAFGGYGGQSYHTPYTTLQLHMSPASYAVGAREFDFTGRSEDLGTSAGIFESGGCSPTPVKKETGSAAGRVPNGYEVPNAYGETPSSDVSHTTLVYNFCGYKFNKFYTHPSGGAGEFVEYKDILITAPVKIDQVGQGGAVDNAGGNTIVAFLGINASGGAAPDLAAPNGKAYYLFKPTSTSVYKELLCNKDGDINTKDNTYFCDYGQGTVLPGYSSSYPIKAEHLMPVFSAASTSGSNGVDGIGNWSKPAYGAGGSGIINALPTFDAWWAYASNSVDSIGIVSSYITSTLNAASSKPTGTLKNQVSFINYSSAVAGKGATGAVVITW